MPLCQLDGCKKKLMLTDIVCKCEKKFCSLHRYSEGHGCKFDYKADHEKNLMKHMSTAVIAKKIDII